MKYIFPALAVVALVLSVVAVMPKEVTNLGGQFSTNYAEFNGITNNSTLTQTGDVTAADDISVSGSLCVKASSVYYTFVPSTTAAAFSYTSSTSACL